MAEACTNCGRMLEVDEACPQCVHPAGKLVYDAPLAVPPTVEPLLRPNVGIKIPDVDEGYRGFDGWLILVAIGLGVTLLQLLSFSVTSPFLFFTAAGQSFFQQHPAMIPVVLGEIVINGIMFLYVVALNFLFYKKKRAFPISYVVFRVLVVVVGIADHLLVWHAMHGGKTLNVAWSVILSAAWITYMLTSRRVKLTFVN